MAVSLVLSRTLRQHLILLRLPYVVCFLIILYSWTEESLRRQKKHHGRKPGVPDTRFRTILSNGQKRRYYALGSLRIRQCIRDLLARMLLAWAATPSGIEDESRRTSETGQFQPPCRLTCKPILKNEAKFSYFLCTVQHWRHQVFF